MAATTSDNVEEEDWFPNINSNTKKLMIKSNNNENYYEQQQAEAKSQLHAISKKSGQADTYLYHCRKLLWVPSCGSDSKNNNNNNNNHRNNKNGDYYYRKASTTTIKNQNLKEQDQVQSKMRLLVINNDHDDVESSQHEVGDLQAARIGRAIQVFSRYSTFSNLFATPKLTGESVCELNQKYHNEKGSKCNESMCNRFGQVLSKKSQALNGESNMILSDVKAVKNRKLFLRKRVRVDKGESECEYECGENDYMVKKKKKRDEIEYFNIAAGNVCMKEEEKEQLREGEERLRERRRQRRRPETRSIKLINRHFNGPIKMWRQLVILSFLSIMLTTLLANLNIIPQMSTSSCLLFNHCHALSVQQQQQSKSSPSSNSIAAPGTKITPILSSSTANSASPTSLSVTPPTISSSTTTSSVNLQKNTFVPTQRPRYPPTNPTTPNSSGASINAPTIPPVSTTQSSNVAVAFVPASSQRLSQPSTTLDKKHSNSSPTSLWSNNLKPTTEEQQQQLHKQQQQQLAKQQQLTQLTGTVANPNKTATESMQEFTTIASVEGQASNNRQKFTFDQNNSNNINNNYQNANHKKSSKSNDINNNGNFQAGARIPMSIRDNSEASSSVVSSITRESHVEPQTTSSSGSNLLRASSSLAEELPAIVVGRRVQQHHHSPLTTTKVPTSTSSGAIKLIASPTLHVSESSSAAATPSPSQLNSSSSSSSFPSSSSRDNKFQKQQPTSPKMLQSIDDGWSISSDGIDSTTTPNSLLNDTSIRYNPGTPPADLYKAADSTGRASVLPGGGSGTKFSSPPASPRQAEGAFQPGHQQFLVPAGGLSMPQNLFQSMIHSALSDLMNNEQLFGSASTTASRPIVLRSRLHPVTIQPTNHHQNQQPLVINNRRFQFHNNNNNNNNNQPSKQSMAASASAPSISLPPLSHFLVPRNPFRLFSSSSTTNPIITRYRPSFMSGKLKTSPNKQPFIANEQHQTNRWSTNIGPHYASAASNSFQRTPPLAFQGSSTLAGLEDGTNTNLYAHSHSAEQLERLVRAASQATGINSPILPAIVSAPSGAFPGYYIPAIESESESQVNELRHGEVSGSSISSKIPGTDYVLHPDEVRAMINIGEIAWRQQQQNEQQGSKSNLNQQQGQDSSISETRDWQFGNRNPSSSGSQGFTGYMQENHAENARDFAYVDPQNRRDQMQAHSSNNNNYNDHHRHHHQHQTRHAPTLNSSELESHLLKHFNQKQLSSFPAIIRVNDQDYIHWPLIKMNQQNNEQQNQQTNNKQHLNHPQHSFDEPNRSKFSASQSIIHPFQISPEPFQRQPLFIGHASQFNNQYRPSGLLQQIPLAAINRLQNHPFPQQQDMAHLEQENHNHAGWTPSASIITPSVMNNPKNAVTGALHPLDNLDQSPVRLATQLTPQEVRQVEDSIIEALIMNQSLQHQRKLMEGLVANQNQLLPTFMTPNQPIISNLASSESSNKKSPSSGIKNGFFGRRRRHNLNSNNNNNGSSNNNNQKDAVSNQEKIKQLLLAASASALSPQLIGPIPLVNISALPIHIISPILAPYTDLPEHAIVGPAFIQPQESLVLESRLAAKQRLPILIADQETNRPNLLRPIDNLEKLSADSSAPKATISNPPSASNKVFDDILSFAGSERASRHSAGGDAAFGSRVSRIKSSPSLSPITSGSSMPWDKSPSSSFVKSERSKSGFPIINSLAESPHMANIDHEMKSMLIRNGNEPFFTDGSNKSKHQILSFSPTNPSTSRPYRHVDWPAMVSDADYFPDGNNNNVNNHPKNPKNNNNYGAQNSAHQQVLAESKNVNQRDKQQSSSSFSNSQGDDNLHFSSSHVIRPSQSTTTPDHNKQQKYITSQLKLQFAQDYQAREGVPIYNNNVRIAGALDRQRSSSSSPPFMLEGGQSSHNIPNRFTSSQRVPSEIDSSNDDGSGSNDDSDEADDESPERDLQQKGSSDKKISTLIVVKPTTTTTIKPEITKSSSTTSVATNNKLNKQNTSRYERRPNSRGPQIGQSQLFD